MTDRNAPVAPASEREVVAWVARHLSDRGYRAYADPDGTDYFDLVARRGEEVGLVEVKRRGARNVLGQALRRRAWGNWTAVVVTSRRTAERLCVETDGRRSEPVGVWWTDGEQVREMRAARPFAPGGSGDDPFEPLRARLRRVLDQIDAGEIPVGVRWDGLLREVRHASGGRGFAEWRLDEGPLP